MFKCNLITLFPKEFSDLAAIEADQERSEKSEKSDSKKSETIENFTAAAADNSTNFSGKLASEETLSNVKQSHEQDYDLARKSVSKTLSVPNVSAARVSNEQEKVVQSVMENRPKSANPVKSDPNLADLEAETSPQDKVTAKEQESPTNENAGCCSACTIL